MVRLTTNPAAAQPGRWRCRNAAWSCRRLGVRVYLPSCERNWLALIRVQLTQVSAQVYSMVCFVGDAGRLDLHDDLAGTSVVEPLEDLGALVLRRPPGSARRRRRRPGISFGDASITTSRDSLTAMA